MEKKNNNNLKTCTKCKKEQNFEEYQMRNDIPIAQCKTCVNETRKLARKKRKENGGEPLRKKMEPSKNANMKICTKCDKEQDLSCFQLRNGKSISQCRICVNEIKADYKRKKRAEELNKKIDDGEIKVAGDKINNKFCSYCDTEKPKSDFRENRNKCGDCERKDGRDYRKGATGKIKSQAWKDEHAERMKELQADWYQKNKTTINKKYVERYHNDPEFRLAKLQKSAMWNAMNHDISNKNIKNVGCNTKFLKKWLKFNLIDDMTMANHGEIWHIDHVIAINIFDLANENQIELCFNWRNVSPLNGPENVSKHDKILPEQVKKHYNNLIKFHEEEGINMPIKYKRLFARHLKMTGTP
jgi:hypothetical protein